jgi:hypothetical protein
LHEGTQDPAYAVRSPAVPPGALWMLRASCTDTAAAVVQPNARAYRAVAPGDRHAGSPATLRRRRLPAGYSPHVDDNALLNQAKSQICFREPLFSLRREQRRSHRHSLGKSRLVRPSLAPGLKRNSVVSASTPPPPTSSVRARLRHLPACASGDTAVLDSDTCAMLASGSRTALA